MAAVEETTHLDINMFRVEKGGDPDVIRTSQKRRFKPVELVDEIIDLDKQWRKAEFELRELKTKMGKLSKECGARKQKGEPTEELQAEVKHIKDVLAPAKEKTMTELILQRNKKMNLIGNLVHDSVVISNNEDENGIVRTWGEKRDGTGLQNHTDVIAAVQGYDIERGTKVAGGRGYFLRNEIVLLNHAIISYGLSFLYKRGYSPIQTPFFMKKDMMAQCAQLEQFDEELYHVTGEGDDKYLIATSEQPIAAMHSGETMLLKPGEPVRYVGMSTNFRKEAGSHGRDTVGIFRTHQFEKLEQFIICSPEGDESWQMQEELIKNAEEFYQTLGLPYRVVNIVSGALNNAAAKKLDLEGWFPGSNNGKGVYRELVSCSNCTDYQSRRLGIKYGTSRKAGESVPYVHMLNSTLCATERLMCCIVENYQDDKGIKIPQVLLPFMHGVEHIPFRNAPAAAAAAPAGK